MKEWKELVSYIDDYIYSQEKEEIIIAPSKNYDMVNRVYQYAINTWELTDISKWEFDIALDCVRSMNESDRVYVSQNTDVYQYHMGYAMYVRNRYIHCSSQHFVWDADGISTNVMRMILSLLHPFYDFSNASLCDLYEDEDYRRLFKQYAEKYHQIFEKAIRTLADKDNTKCVEDVIKTIKNEIRSIEGRDGFKKIFVETVKECLARSNKKSIAQVWNAVENKLYDRAVIYNLEYKQIKCVENIGILREVQYDYMERKKFISVKECADYIEENLGFKREHAEFMAECAIGAFKE